MSFGSKITNKMKITKTAQIPRWAQKMGRIGDWDRDIPAVTTTILDSKNKFFPANLKNLAQKVKEKHEKYLQDKKSLKADKEEVDSVRDLKREFNSWYEEWYKTKIAPRGRFEFCDRVFPFIKSYSEEYAYEYQTVENIKGYFNDFINYNDPGNDKNSF